MEPDAQAARIYERLMATAKPVRHVHAVPVAPGIYAVLFLGSTFPMQCATELVKPGTLIYIGKAKQSLDKRVLQEEFRTGKTGQATLRRSLGALLRIELGLKPIPRSRTEESASRNRNYKFSVGGETSLTKWMRENLALSYHEYAGGHTGLKALEEKLISLTIPVLNLKDNPRNPCKAELSAARATCVRLARKA